MSIRQRARSLAARSLRAGEPSVCTECGRPLTAVERLVGRTACAEHRASVDRRREGLRARYLGAITAFDLDTDPTPSEIQTLADVTPASVGVQWHERVASSALMYVLEQAIANSSISAEQAAKIARLSSLSGVPLDVVTRGKAEIVRGLTIGAANGGRLTPVPNPSARLRKHEVCYFDEPAALLKPEHAGGTPTQQGVAAAKGAHVPIRRLVDLPELGAGLRVWDEGRLLITGERLFFEGNFINLQVPHRRLIGFNLFRDGLQIRIAGRRAEPIVRVADPIFAAAVGNAAWQQTATPLPRVYAVDSFESLPVSREDSLRSGSAPVRG